MAKPTYEIKEGEELVDIVPNKIEIKPLSEVIFKENQIGDDGFIHSVNADVIQSGVLKGIPVLSNGAGARIQFFPNSITGLQVIDNAENDVFKTIIGGTDVGDVIIGNYASNQGAKYDKSVGTFDFKGVLTAESGVIGGWNIDATRIYSNSDEIVLDSANTKIMVGATNPITIDGANKRIQSDNYVSGYAGSGFHLDEDLLEVGNIACRGLIRTAVFQKDVVNVMGGNFMVLDGDVLDEDMTALDASTLTTKATTTFSAGDILRIKDGTDDEWLEVKTGYGSSTELDSYNESNQDASTWRVSSGRYYATGQSFLSSGSGKLSTCKFYIKKNGSPTGNAVAKLYAHDISTFGNTGRPTGSALATSDVFDVSTLTTNYQLITFTFTGAEQYVLANGTHYFIILSYAGGDINNYVYVGSDSSSPTHEGNVCIDLDGAPSWASNNGHDICFYVYYLPVNAQNPYACNRDKKGDYGVDTNPTWKKGATIVNYKQSGDGGVYMTASETNAPYLSVFTTAGSPWTDLSTKLRIGNLNGYLGYSSDLYGIAIGETTKYLKYDPTNGLRIRGTLTIESGSTGVANLGDAGNLATTDEADANVLNMTNAPAAADADVTQTIIDGGLITTGYITLNTAGHIKSGQTAYNTGSGFWLGNDSGTRKFSIGDGGTSKYLTYDGTDFVLKGGTLISTRIKTAPTGTFRTEIRESGATLGDEIVFVSSANVDLAHLGGLSDGTLKLSNSTGTTHLYLTVAGAKLGYKGHLEPYTDADYDLGSASYRVRTIYPRFISITQADTNEDLPPVYITSAQDSNVINYYNTNATIANRPAFRFESNNANSELAYFKQTANYLSVVVETNSSAQPALYVVQSGTAYIVNTNVAGCFLTKAGVWTDASSKTMKENFENITTLDKLKNLDIKKYNYISEKRQNKTDIKNWLINKKKREKYSKTDKGRKSSFQDTDYLKQKITSTEKIEIEKELPKEYAQELKRPVPKHISPMAEDFYKEFGVGDDKGISAKDLAGVAIQAIKELNQKVDNNLIIK